MKRNEKGFTLIEMLIVVVIIGVLSSIVLPRITGNAKDAKIKACLQQIASINSTVELIMFEQSIAAPSATFATVGSTAACDTITAGMMAQYFPDGGMLCPVGSVQYVLASGRVNVGVAATGHNDSGGTHTLP